MAAKDCSGCGSSHDPPLHRRCPLRSGNTEDSDDNQDTDLQASHLHNSDSHVSDHQTKGSTRQVSGSGLFDSTSSDPTQKSVSTEIVLLRELKNISKRFNSLEEQAAKDRRMIADMATKLQAQESRIQSDHVNVVYSPRREQVRHSVSHASMDTINGSSGVIRPLINGSQQRAVTQIPGHSIIKLNAVRTPKNVQMPSHNNTFVSSVNGTFPLPSVSYPQFQVPGGAAAATAGNTQQSTATAQTRPLPLVSDICYSLGQEQISGASHLLSTGAPILTNQVPQLTNQARHSLGQLATTTSSQQPTGVTEEEDTLIPSLQALKNSQAIHHKVNRRYQELEDAVQVSPGNLDILLETIQKKVHKEAKQKPKWPQDLAFVGSLRKRPSYDQLTTCQWMLGFLRICQEEQDATIRENMVEYLTELLQDTCDYSWESAKGAHSVLLHRMQDGVVNWSNLKEVNKIRKRYAQTSSAHQGVVGERSKITKVVPCFKYNKGSCPRNSDHEWQNMLLKHSCQHCFSTFNRHEMHTKKECTKAPKN